MGLILELGVYIYIYMDGDLLGIVPKSAMTLIYVS